MKQPATVTRTELAKLLKPHKYGAERIEIDGLKFDSTKEAKRWGELKIMERVGLIAGLERQSIFPLAVNGILICHYIADFCYTDEHGKQVIEDVKSPPTRRLQAYRIKRALVKALYQIEIQEV